MKGYSLLVSKIKSIFRYLSDNQIQSLIEYYLVKPSLISAHKKDFLDIVEKGHGDIMTYLNHNDIMQSDNHWDNDGSRLSEVSISGDEYIALFSGNTVVLFDKKTNKMFDYRKVYWKSTGIRIYISSSSRYGEYNYPRPDVQAVRASKKDLSLIKQFDEFKYIDFTKLKELNWYTVLENRFNKKYLWQLEMLIKGGFYRLADEIHRTHELIDFKVFSKYMDYFKDKRRGLSNLRAILRFREIGLEDPEFIYLESNWYLMSNYTRDINWFSILKMHPEIKKERFLKYISRRKNKITTFGTKFIDTYYVYLLFMETLKLDLSRDKFAFPDNLEESLNDIIYTVNPYDFKKDIITKFFDYSQSKLRSDEQHEIYVISQYEAKLKLRKEKKAQKRKMLKEAKDLERSLAVLFDYNKNLHIQIDDTYVLVAPTSREDLLKEGKTLNHCVYGYLKSMAKGESTVLFLRKKGHEDKPYYTVEVINGVVTQCRSTNNLDPSNLTEYVKYKFKELNPQIRVQCN